MAGGGCGGGVGGGGPLSQVAEDATKLPNPSNSGLEHVVVVMMENRSFDHFLGWLPKANGEQAGLTYYDKLNQPHPTYHLTEDQNCTKEDPDHSYDGSRVQHVNSECDRMVTG